MMSYRLLRLLDRIGIRTRYADDLEAVRASALFDAAWYRAQLKAGRSPRDLIVHYLLSGAGRGDDPHPRCDTRRYADGLAKSPDARMNPLAHYQTTGDANGHNPSLWFDGSFYRAAHGLTLPEGVTALRDYWETGQFAGRSPHPLFELAWYRERYPGRIAHDNPVVDLAHARGSSS